MGIRIRIGDLDYEATDYSVQEASGPTAAGDSSGSVGQINFTIKTPEPLPPARPMPNVFGNPGLRDVDGSGVPAFVSGMNTVRAQGWPSAGEYYLQNQSPGGYAYLLGIPLDTTVTIRARYAGQQMSWGSSTLTSTNSNEDMVITYGAYYHQDFYLGPGDWSAPVAQAAPSQIETEHPILKYGVGWLQGQDVSLTDTRYGYTLGEVSDTSEDRSTRSIRVTCFSRLGRLNVYDVQAQPYSGTLGGAFAYYCSLAGLDTDISVDTSITNRPVNLPGWHGELWYYMKMLAAAQDCEVALVAGTVFLRPIRTREVRRGRDFSRSVSSGGGPLAQAVEVYWYDTSQITNELVYPPEGWTPEVEILNVNAGETTEYQLELSASLSSIVAPTMQTFVGQHEDDASVYTIVADDGLPVDPDLWEKRGGRVEITLNPDTTSLTVTLTGATHVQLTGGEVSQSFSLALASDNSGSRYSTLRILGTGVRYLREKVRIRTGVTASQTGTDVGVTIDNIFINDINTLYTLGVRAASDYTGMTPGLSGTVSSVTDRGEGAAPSISYGAVEDELGSRTYASTQTYYTSTLGLNTYGAVQDYWESTVADEFSRQIFGGVQGARVWDRDTKRWYRIRQGTLGPSNITFNEADDDLTWADIQEAWDGNTYGVVESWFSDLTYQQVELAGLYVGN